MIFPGARSVLGLAGAARLTTAMARLMAVLLAPALLPLPVTSAHPSHPAPADAQRAITLAPHITELIFAAGAGDRVIATVASSDYPQTARTLPRVGDGLSISVEKIMALGPDTVIAWRDSAALRALQPILQNMRVPLLYSEPRSLSDIPEQIRRFGALFKTLPVAEAAAQALEDRLATLRARHGRRPVRSVFVEVGTMPLYTLGADPLLNEMLAICSGANLYADAPVAAAQVGVEDILARNPDLILVPATDEQQTSAALKRWSALGLPAARAGRVYGIHPDLLFRPGPRLVDAAEELCKKMDYPVRPGSTETQHAANPIRP